MHRGFPGGSAVKNPPANAGNVGDRVSVPALGGRDPLEEEMAAWGSPAFWDLPRDSASSSGSQDALLKEAKRQSMDSQEGPSSPYSGERNLGKSIPQRQMLSLRDLLI